VGERWWVRGGIKGGVECREDKKGKVDRGSERKRRLGIEEKQEGVKRGGEKGSSVEGGVSGRRREKREEEREGVGGRSEAGRGERET